MLLKQQLRKDQGVSGLGGGLVSDILEQCEWSWSTGHHQPLGEEGGMLFCIRGITYKRCRRLGFQGNL